MMVLEKYAEQSAAFKESRIRLLNHQRYHIIQFSHAENISHLSILNLNSQLIVWVKAQLSVI